VEALAGSRRVAVGGPRQRLILATLVLGVNRTVSTSDLAEVVWGDDPPTTARRQVANAVWQLRRALERHGGATLIHGESDGYRLEADPGLVDLVVFENGVARGRRLAAAGQIAKAARELRRAMSLWRGPALAGLTGDALERQAARLEELRLTALEDCLEYELAGGGCGDGIAELSDLAARHPLRERLASALMLALYRGGRQAEALATYHRVAAALAEELGVDPGPELQERFQAILRRDPRIESTAGPAALGVRPAQLPPDVFGFVGREDELRGLATMMAAHRAQPTAVVIAALSGPAGVGKSALAVHFAHRVADRFPGGQLHLNLRGFDPGEAAVRPEQALRAFLDALGVPSNQQPSDLDAQIGLYRSLVATAPMLVVLDNARDVEQVRPLLPGAPNGLVIVTSRNQLTGLVAIEGAHGLALDVLTAAEARDLLGRRLGPGRVVAEPQAVGEIIAHCAHLPLALAVAAGRVALRPELTLAAVADELRDRHARLDAFADSDATIDVRAVLSWSYRTLGADPARMFRLLGLHPGPDIGIEAAASLAGVTRPRVAPLLAALAEGNLITEHSPGRFTFHDLLRSYARELAHDLDPADARQAATRRVLDHYLHTANGADRLILPDKDRLELDLAAAGVMPESFTTADEAVAWFATEHPVLRGCLPLAEDAGLNTHTWQLAWVLADFYQWGGHWNDWVVAQEAAVVAAQRLDHRPRLAQARRVLARAYNRSNRFDEARTQFGLALEEFRAIGDKLGEARVHLGYCTMTEVQGGDYRDALDHAWQATRLYRAVDNKPGEAGGLNAVGWFHARLGEYERALDHCQQALRLHRESGDRLAQADTLDSIGFAYHRLGQHQRAIVCYRQALELYGDLGERYTRGIFLHHLGDAHHAAGEVDAAREAWDRCLEIFDALGHPDAAEVRAKLKQHAPRT
jgi:DNA-binding SARP family transcriptional activator/tetratricopeptide (TPR) repeat protein